MKKMKKYLSMSLAVIMALAMAAPSFADPGNDELTPENPPVVEQTMHNPKTNIIMNDQPEGATERVVDYNYVAYKLLNASNGANADGNYDLYAYTVNETYEEVLKAALPEGHENDDVIAYLATLTGENNEALREYANKVYRAIKTANMPADATSDESRFENVDQGYYLIADITNLTGVDEDGNPILSDDTNSLVMLNTAGKENLPVKVKKDKPTVDKKIVDGGTEVDTSDATRNEEITYRLKGTLPSDYAIYKEYSYKFIDTLSDGLDFVSEVADVVVKIDDTALTAAEMTANEVSVVITGKELTVEFKDLKKFENITKDTKIYVEYKAELNDSAVVGAPGNNNGVKLEYSNNPYSDGKGDKGTTPDKYVELLTFQLTINKIDEKNKAPLAGAGFTLFKQNGASWDELQVISGVDKDGVVNGKTQFDFKQLGEGTYKIEETTVPDGYNKADDITFTIVAETKQVDGDTTKAEITKLELTNVKVGNEDKEAKSVLTVGQKEDGSISGIINTTIENSAGTILPSTGGIGTTIFYAAGIILMAGAVFFVVRRKRA